MAILENPAITIRITDYSETSLIVALFTRDFGLVRAIFKGARRKAKAYESAIGLLVLGELSFYERASGLNILKKFATREDFPELGKDLNRYRAAMACLEFVRTVAVEGEPATGLFDMFRDGLRACAEGKHPWAGAYAFVTAGLAQAGFRPSLDACASCAGHDFPAASRARRAFSFEEGGVLCKKCATRRTAGKVGMWLTSEVIKLLAELERLGPAEAAGRGLTPAAAREVRAFLRRYYEFTFEQPFRMLK